jgi:hypothetical protein
MAVLMEEYMDKFIVRHYVSDKHSIIKGNGFDGTTVGDEREDAEDFIGFINKIISICNDNFSESYMVQPHAGAPYECRFCGMSDDSHELRCPVKRYNDLQR